MLETFRGHSKSTFVEDGRVGGEGGESLKSEQKGTGGWGS